jgi:hypothetical protein
VCLLYIGCDNPTEPTTYYHYEFFRVSITDYDKLDKLSGLINFEAVENYKNELKKYSVQIHDTGDDATERDIYELLINSGESPNGANEIISFLNETGNNVIKFEYADDGDNDNDDYYFLAYFEKL